MGYSLRPRLANGCTSEWTSRPDLRLCLKSPYCILELLGFLLGACTREREVGGDDEAGRGYIWFDDDEPIIRAMWGRSGRSRL